MIEQSKTCASTHCVYDAEGKRTLMLIHLLGVCTARERRTLRSFLAKPRAMTTSSEVAAVYAQMLEYGSIEFARLAARQLAGAALLEAVTVFCSIPESPQKKFILKGPLYG